MFPWILVLMGLVAPQMQKTPQLQNPGFESAVLSPGQISGWQVWTEEGAGEKVRVQIDSSQFKEGSHALLIDSQQPVDSAVSQELFLPVGSTWKVSAWVKADGLRGRDGLTEGGAFQIETPVGDQGRRALPFGRFD